MSTAKAISANFDTSPDVKTAPPPLAKRLNRIVMLIAALFLLNATLEFSTQSRQVELLKIGDKIPPFSLALMGGGKMTEKSFAGKPTMYFFFANWCPCSHASVPWIKKAGAQYAKDGLAVVFIGVQDSTSNLKKFAHKHKLASNVNVSGGDDFAGSVGVKITPTTVFTDSQGVIRSIFIGKVVRYDQLQKGLESIVPGQSQGA